MGDELSDYCIQLRHSSAQDAETVIQNIEDYFKVEQRGSELDLAFSTIFNENNGLLSYVISKFSVSQQFSKPVIRVFQFFNYLLGNFHTRVDPHLKKIKDVCVQCLLRVNSTSEMKENAADLLVVIIQNSSFDHNEIQQFMKKMFQLMISNKSTNNKTMPPKAMQKMYHLMGTVARYYMIPMQEQISCLERLYFNELEYQTTRSAHVSFLMINGCLTGFSESLYNFPLTNPADCKRLYEYLKKLSDPGEGGTKRFAQRAAIKLLADHGMLFSEYVYSDYRFWHKRLLMWFGLSKDDIAVADLALNTFYNIVSINLKDDVTDSGRGTFNYFMKYFKEKMMSTDSSENELRIVIRAFGCFSASCQTHMDVEDVNFMFILIVQRIEHKYFQNAEQEKVTAVHLPHYIYCLGKILGQLKNVGDEKIVPVQRIMVLLVEEFPSLPITSNSASVNSLITVFQAFAEIDASVLKKFLSIFVYQGIIRTCSHDIALDVELQKDMEYADKKRLISYKNYLPLWVALLRTDLYIKAGFDLQQAESLVTDIYGQFIKTLIKMTQKLNLNTRRKQHSTMDTMEDEVPVLDPESGLEACVPADFKLFINFVDFFRDLLNDAKEDYFKKWIELYLNHIITLTIRNPLVSGFYKLLTIALKICDKLHYFKHYGKHQKEDAIVLNLEAKNRLPCYIMVCKFLRELATRLKQFKGDLQIACLQTVVSAPVQLVHNFIIEAAQVFLMMFKLGRSILSCAHMALSELERWYAELPEEDTKPLLITVLPYLDHFLQSTGVTEELISSDENIKDSYKARKRRKTPVQGKLLECPETALFKLQKKILTFLGQLKSDTCVSLITCVDEEQSMTWNNTQHLTYVVPFVDMKPSIHLDKFVPRILDLALHSSNRQARVAACELLHSIVMVMLGTNMQKEISHRGHLSELFRKLAMPLFQLGCDSDQVVYQLFNPLGFQLARWYSSGLHLRSIHTQIFVETLMDGITHPTDTSIRDYCAKCLYEFVVWSIKQSTPENLAQSPVNIKAVLKKMFSFCLHPCPTKRLGAALIFNSIYRILREEQAIVELFWVEILYYLVKNLSMFSHIEDFSGANEQVLLALDHVERVFKEQPTTFINANSNRRCPPELDDTKLYNVLLWLLKLCGTLQPECRHKCMELVCQFSPLLSEYKSVRAFFGSFSRDKLLEVCEPANFTVEPTVYNRSAENIIIWLNHLLASLDCYGWMIGEHLVEPSVLLETLNIRLFDAIQNFMKLFVGKTLEQAMDLSDNSKLLCMPAEQERYNTVKCFVIVRLFDFVNHVLKCKSGLHFMSPVLGDSLWNLISQCIFQPSVVGFDMDNVEVLNNLPIAMRDLLVTLKQADLLVSLHVRLRNLVNLHDKELTDQLSVVLKTGCVDLQQIQYLEALVTLQNASVLEQIKLEMNVDNIIPTIFSAMSTDVLGEKYAVEITPAVQKYCEKLLNLVLSLKNQDELLIKHILDTSKVKYKNNNSSLCLGEYFLTIFMDSIFEYFSKQTESVLTVLIDVKSTPAYSICSQFLKYLAQKGRKTRAAEVACSVIVPAWHTILDWTNLNEENVCLTVSLLQNMAFSMKYPIDCLRKYPEINKWVIQHLSSRHFPYHYKIRVLDLLPFLTGSADEVNPEFNDSLKELKKNHFPKFSNELPAGSLEHGQYVLAFKKILYALKLSGSRILLRNIISMVAMDNNHVCKTEIQETLQKFIQRLDTENQLKSLEVPYGIWTSSTFSTQIRLGTVEKFMKPLLENCSISAARQFYVKHIYDIKKLLEEDFKSAASHQKEENIVRRICAWNLLEILFVKFDSEELENPKCEITLASKMERVETGRELIALLTKKAYYTRTEACSEPSFEGLFRQLQCAAYIALSAIISNTKRDPSHEKFYCNFLFNESKDKNQILWQKLLDCSYEYSFELDWEEIPTRRKKLVSIRQVGRADQMSGAPKYVPTNTQYLFESTLKEDVTQFDFTTSTLISPEEAATSEITNNIEVALENVSLNDHECMPVLCGVLDHMITLNISPQVTPGELVSLPSWMASLKQSLEDVKNPRNVKLFILRLIVNRESVFRPFAKFWLYPILKTVMDGCFGSNVNHFLMDILIMLLSWHSVAIPETEIEKNTVSEVLDFLVHNAHHNRRDIFKHNLEVLKTMVEVWKLSLQIKKQYLYESIEMKGSDTRSSEAGIQIVGIFLANEIQPWTESGKRIFLLRLLQNLDSDKADIYLACAEVIGMALKVLNIEVTAQLSEDNGFLQEVKTVLNKQKSSNNIDKFLHCLYGIHKHYAAVVDDFINILMFHVPKLFASFRVMALEIICSRLETIKGNVFLQLKDMGLLSFLVNKDSDVQIVALHIILKLVTQLELPHLQEILPEVCKFAKQHLKIFRQIMYDILILIYEKYNGTLNDSEKQLVEESKAVLLGGLMDNDTELQKTIFRFWCKEKHLSVNPAKRMAALFSHLYSPHTDSHMIGYTSSLLIEATTHSPDYLRKIFDHPLSSCKFEDYKVLVSWRAQHSTIAPMFANTLASQLTQSQTTDFVVRATQASLAFQPTVETDELDSKISRDQSFMSFQTQPSSSSHLLYTVGSGSVSDTSHNYMHRFEPKQYLKKFGETEGLSPLAHLKRRFLRSQHMISTQFAKREVGRKIRRKEMQDERIKKRDAVVEMFRSYRIGDLPDIEIPNSAVLKPLQALAKCDVIIARQMLVSMFDGILNELKDEESSHIWFLQSMEESLNGILKNSVQCPAPLVGTIFEISLNNKQQITLNAEYILQVSRSSGLLSLGALLLEEMLICEEDCNDPLPSKKLKCLDDNGIWLKLAELYANLDEWDVIRGVFKEKVECKDSVHAALSAEAEGLWKKAKEEYQNSLDESSSYVRDYCYQAFYKCLAHLSEWKNLNENVWSNTSDGTDLSSLWDDSWSQEYVLPWLFTSEVQLKLSKYNGALDEWPLLTTVNEWLKDKDKSVILRSKYSYELAAMFTLMKDFERANHHAAEGVTMFLENWTHISTLLPKLRHHCLSELQKNFDLNTYLNFAAQSKYTEYENEVYKQINKWNSSLPQPHDMLLLWDQRSAFRCGLITQMKCRLRELSPDDSSVEVKSLNLTKCKVELAFAEMALKQNNFYIAKQALLLTKPLLKDIGDSSLSTRWQLILSQARLLYAKLEDDALKKLELTFKSWNDLDPLLTDDLTSHSNLFAQAQQHQCAITSSILSQIIASPDIIDSAIEDINKRIILPETSVVQVTSSLEKFGLDCLNKAAEELLNSSGQKVSQDDIIADAYLQIATYCRSLSEHDDLSKHKYESDILKSVLRAMKYGSRKAKQLYPSLLQLPSLSSNLAEVFQNELKHVPKWMFLTWVNQILASLDTEVGPVLLSLVEDLTKEYPQAVIYPFLISCEKYTYQNKGGENIVKPAVKRLKMTLLKNPVFKTILLAFSYLSQPIDMVIYYLISIADYLEEKPPNVLEAESTFHSLMRDAFPPARENPHLHGNVFKAIKEYQDKIIKIVGKEFCNAKACKGSTVNVTQKLRSISQELKNKKNDKKFTPPKLLRDYSPWLENFHERYLDDLEIPGQYTGEHRPLPQYHVKIVGFDSKVEPISGSLRRPLKITILGNDAKEHNYLMKFGEDLRQDQRIQQLFRLMNEILSEDRACVQRHLNVSTYQVIPLSSCLGMIEWVDSTKPLQSFITDSLTEEEKIIFYSISNRHVSWLPTVKDNSYRNQYFEAYKKFSRDKTIAKFREFVNEIPSDILKRSLYQMSLSPEAFISLRQKFVCSYATMCICHWILGIGDRHLSNSLVSLKNAQCIGIDFGHSFGTATQFLPIPELIPFRLTPHIIDVMQPFGCTGMFEETMVHVLKALRSNPDVLLSTMEVFVQEPSMDWLKFSRTQRKNFKEIDKCDAEWFPREKIKSSRYKLEGANPVTITETELRSNNFCKEPVFRHIVGVLHGVKQHNIRARQPEFNLKVETQVECLIDQATDYHILGLTYYGWSPWV